MSTCFDHYVVIFRPLKYMKLSIISSFCTEVDENALFWVATQTVLVILYFFLDF
jgi:hypothetical protein